jgi:hypothetical protein
MEPPNEQPNYVTCSCQHCNGHIKFGADQLRKGETRRIECPHCHLETIIFHPHTDGKDSPSAEKINPARGEARSHNPKGIQPNSTKTELFVFGIVRFGILTSAMLVLIAFFIAAGLAVSTWLPENPKSIAPIPYAAVAPVQQTTQTNKTPFVPIGAKMAGTNSFPKPVVDFLLAHEGFSLKVWLDQIKTEHRRAFLDNLAAILQTANTNHLTAGQLEQAVRDFADLWIAQNEKAPDPNAALEKLVLRASCISTAFGLFITLTILCLILVLLAIERNTRKKDSPATQ